MPGKQDIGGSARSKILRGLLFCVFVTRVASSSPILHHGISSLVPLLMFDTCSKARYSIDKRIGSPLGEPLAAETRAYLGPFEPDLVRTSVGKWSLRIYSFGMLCFVNRVPGLLSKPLQFSGAAFLRRLEKVVTYGLPALQYIGGGVNHEFHARAPSAGGRYF